MTLDVGVLSALLLILVLALTIAVGAIISLRNECARERHLYAAHYRATAPHTTQSFDPGAGPEQVWPGGDAGPDHTTP